MLLINRLLNWCFSLLLQNANITLSPLPLLVNNNLASPRCQITNNLFIMPYDTPTNNGVNKGKTLEYHFSRSPSKVSISIKTYLQISFIIGFVNCCRILKRLTML